MKLHSRGLVLRHCPFAMENQVAVGPSRTRRRRRKRDSVELSLFSYVKSQCSQHELSDFCTYRNCHFQNLECLEKLLMSARKSIQVAMYQFSVRSINDAIKSAKDKNNVDVQIIVDSKMRLNQGSIFQEMIAYGEYTPCQVLVTIALSLLTGERQQCFGVGKKGATKKDTRLCPV